MNEGHHHGTTIHRIDRHDDHRRAGFVATYIDVFAGPPYFEHYSEEDVHDGVWVPHQGHCILVATDASECVVGLACCHPVFADTEPKIRDYLREQDVSGLFDPDRTIFMSELAVRDGYRQRGLGQELILARFRWGVENGFTSYCMRTAAEGSNSRRMYERIGARLAPFVQDLPGEATASKQRVYMYGNLHDVLSAYPH